MYVRSCDIVLLTFDLTNKNSFKNLKKWHTFVINNFEVPKIILVGNKVDLDIYLNVEDKDIEKYIEKDFRIKPEYFKTSAKENINIKELFNYIFKISREIIEKRDFKYECDEDIVDINKKNNCCSIL